MADEEGEFLLEEGEEVDEGQEDLEEDQDQDQEQEQEVLQQQPRARQRARVHQAPQQEQAQQAPQGPNFDVQLVAQLVQMLANKDQPQSSDGRKQAKAKDYDGTMDYAIYRVQFQKLAQNNKWTELDKETALIGALTGEAAKVINNLHHRNMPITFHNLDEALLKSFAREQSLWERKLAFESITQSDTQTIGEFAREIEIKGRAYMRDMQEKDIQEALVERFINGLSNEEAKTGLAYASIPTLHEAITSVNRGMTMRIKGPPAKKVRLTRAEENCHYEEESGR